MTQQTKSDLIKRYRKQYKRAGKKEKKRILDILVEATGYSRKHIIHALNQEVDVPRKITRKRVSSYETVIEPLKTLWAASNLLCGKRLKPFIPELLKSLKRHKEIEVTRQQEDLLLKMSAATIDRLLVQARKGLWPKGRSTTKPGTLLKHRIAVRTANDWNDDRPGFFEIDLVAHCGESTAGEYINTLDMTDISTGWTICVPFIGRSERFCLDAIETAKGSLPFPMRGIDSDNDGIFVNYHLERYCRHNNLAFTRSRPYKKNDQCRVEQKNWDVVRKFIGYGRFETPEQLEMLERIYNLLSLYQNYFQPSQKLVQKIRIGSKVRKKHDAAQTPAQRLLTRHDTSNQAKLRLRHTQRELNPAQLLRDIQALVQDLYDL
jgi:hypothetical protein